MTLIRRGRRRKRTRRRKRRKKKKKKMIVNLEFGKLVYIKHAQVVYLLLTVPMFRNIALEYSQVHKKP